MKGLGCFYLRLAGRGLLNRKRLSLSIYLVGTVECENDTIVGPSKLFNNFQTML